VAHVINNQSSLKRITLTAIEDVWGIGRRYAIKMQLIRINNGMGFHQFTNQYVQRNDNCWITLTRDLSGIQTLI
jgi:hypothetical protein